MAITNHKHITFIKEMATHGNRIKAYRVAYSSCQCDKTAATNAARLMKNAEIAEAISIKRTEITAIVNHAVAEKVTQEISGSVLTFAKKREILAEIAAGRYPLKKQIPGGKKGRLKTVTVYPNHTNIKDAIELDNRMTGDFAADKRDINLNTGTKVVEKLDDNKFTELINAINNSHGKNSSGNSPGIQGTAN